MYNNYTKFVPFLQYHRGRAKEKIWVLGILHKQGRKKLPIFKVLRNRSDGELIPLIQKYVLPGSEITTDCWAGYNRLQQLNYIHNKVNHSRHFVDPITGEYVPEFNLWLYRSAMSVIKLNEGSVKPLCHSVANHEQQCQHMLHNTDLQLSH